MRLKCIDGKTRTFQVARLEPIFVAALNKHVPSDTWEEAKCVECGEEFGVHSTKLLKIEFVFHVCR